jgi:hypothetical protein
MKEARWHKNKANAYGLTANLALVVRWQQNPIILPKFKDTRYEVVVS